ncbi:DUF1318 domain-containing protein [Thermodesulfobacteriota bacterium]
MRALIGIMLVCIVGCSLAEVKVEVMSERTALENQVLGTYNALDREMLLVASVRGVDSRGRIKKPAKQSQEHKDAVTALQILSFHADDLQTFKQLGWAGENNQGLVEVFQMNKADIPESLKDFSERFKPEEFNHVVSQINGSREIIMHRVIDMNENLSSDDMPEIRRIFGRLNTENALPGEKVQQPDGTWTVKK